MNEKVDAFLAKSKRWKREFEALRGILLGCPVAEDLKWGKPCYTHDGKNIVLMHGFKEYCALLFFKGALLEDPKGVLITQTQTTQAQRQIRFTSAQQIAKLAPVVKAYVRQAIEIEKSGRQVPFKKTSEFAVPEELRVKLAANKTLKAAFEALTPGRQRAYLLHFAGAKQSKTRASRVDKWIPQILAGKGLDD